MLAVFLKIISYLFLVLFVLGVVLMLLTWRKEKFVKPKWILFGQIVALVALIVFTALSHNPLGKWIWLLIFCRRDCWRLFLRPDGACEKIRSGHYDELHVALCHYMGRAVVYHAIFDNQHGARPRNCAGTVRAQHGIEPRNEQQRNSKL